MELKKSNGVDLGHTKFSFRIDEKHQMKAIWALINLYSDKIGTPVQEIICNARDAHREVGKPDHTFKIYLKDNKFMVRDYGSGINPEKAQNIFCSIGMSTKTGDNKQTGGFGIGAKSPLAYTGQFEVKSWVNGIEYFYIIAKNGDQLEMNLIYEKASDLENGTLVSIPIASNIYSQSDEPVFRRSIEKVIAFWKDKPETNFKLDFVTKVLDLNNTRHKRHNVAFFGDSDIVLVDGIPYIYNGYGSKKLFVFNTGEIRLHETRERLGDTKEDRKFNVSKIEKAEEEIKKEYGVAYPNYVDLKDFRKSALELATFSMFPEVKLEKSWNIAINVLNSAGTYYFSRKTRKGEMKVHRQERLARTSLKDYFVYNDNNEKSFIVSKKINNLVLSKGLSVYLIESPTEALIELLQVTPISKVELPKMERGIGEKKNYDISYKRFYATGIGNSISYYSLEHDQLNNTDKYLYFDLGDSVNGSVLAFLRSKGMQVIGTYKKYLDLIEEKTNTISYQEAIKKYIPTKEELDWIKAINTKVLSVFVNTSEVLDDRLKEYQSKVDVVESARLGKAQLPESLYPESLKEELVLIKKENDNLKTIEDYIKATYPNLMKGSLFLENNTEYVNALYSYRNKLDK